jgi:hypothetical protein
MNCVHMFLNRRCGAATDIESAMSTIRRGQGLVFFLALGSALLSAACGKSASSSGSEATGGTSGSPGLTDAAAPTGCPTNALKIAFEPMFSAYIPNSVHTFQIPAVVNGLDSTVIPIAWSASDPSMVDLENDPTTGGVLITTKNSGTVSIIANAGSLCGASLLTITAATDEDWTDGNARYNDGVVINRIPRNGGGAGGAATDGGAQQAACTNCHGPTATDLQYKTVAHTPEQTGGFSDADLTNIFQDGVFPIGDGTATAPQGFDLSITSYAIWHSFHKWDVGDTPQNVVVYLRSLTPTAQTGTSNFNGGFDGGVRPAGGGTGGRSGRGGAGGTSAGGTSAGGTSAGGTSAGGTSAGGTSAGGTGGA